MTSGGDDPDHDLGPEEKDRLEKELRAQALEALLAGDARERSKLLDRATDSPGRRGVPSSPPAYRLRPSFSARARKSCLFFFENRIAQRNRLLADTGPLYRDTGPLYCVTARLYGCRRERSEERRVGKECRL